MDITKFIADLRSQQRLYGVATLSPTKIEELVGVLLKALKDAAPKPEQPKAASSARDRIVNGWRIWADGFGQKFAYGEPAIIAHGGIAPIHSDDMKAILATIDAVTARAERAEQRACDLRNQLLTPFHWRWLADPAAMTAPVTAKAASSIGQTDEDHFLTAFERAMGSMYHWRDGLIAKAMFKAMRADQRARKELGI